MGFAAPLALFGLLAIVVPVIAHLLRRQDVPVRALPTIAFLKRAEAASRRRVRVVDPWLLLTRMVLVTLAALALAAPFFVSTLAWGDGRVASLVLVLDDSMSMGASDGDATTMERASLRAREVIRALPSGSEIAVILAGSPPRLAVPRTEDLALALRAIEALPRPGARGTSMSEALALAIQQLGGARQPDRRILVLTDGAEHAHLSALEPSGDIELEIEALRETSPVNLALTEARAAPDPTLPGHLSVAIQARAFPPNRAPSEPLEVVIRRGEAVIGRGVLRFAEGIAEAHLHVPTPNETEGIAAEVAFAQRTDQLAADDHRGVLLREGAGIQALLVDGDPRPLARRGAIASSEETRFLAHALSALPSDSGASALVYRTVDADALEHASLRDIDVLVLANVDVSRRSVDARLSEFTQHGGLLVSAGDHLEREIEALAPYLPARIVSKSVGSVTGLRQRAPLGAVDPGAGTQGFEAVDARARLVLEPNEGAEVVLEWSDGLPALVLDRARRTALFGTTLDDAWTDLPYRPGYLPLMTALLRTLAPEGTVPDEPISPGSGLVLAAPPEAERTILIGPGGAVVEASEHEVQLDGLSEPGAWRVRFEMEGRSNESTRSAFVIAAPVDESDLSAGELPVVEARAATAQREATVVQRSVAHWAFGLVGLLAMLEGALRMRRDSRPSARHTATS